MNGPSQVLRVLPFTLTICRLPPDDPIPLPDPAAPFFSMTRTEEELSLITVGEEVPFRARAETGWRALEVEGPLPLDQTGVMASLAAPLAEAGIALFAVSTFGTDYLLVREESLAAAVEALSTAGHRVRGETG